MSGQCAPSTPGLKMVHTEYSTRARRLDTQQMAHKCHSSTVHRCSLAHPYPPSTRRLESPLVLWLTRLCRTQRNGTCSRRTSCHPSGFHSLARALLATSSAPLTDDSVAILKTFKRRLGVTPLPSRMRASSSTVSLSSTATEPLPLLSPVTTWPRLPRRLFRTPSSIPFAPTALCNRGRLTALSSVGTWWFPPSANV